ncbi:SDR family oxidoreductase [Streptomyces netropsis]|uniref:NAD(P)-dependent dehydrogenase (Short-subunit alcohol dehydrogenase family) n=1 Tax=Streptomyces netropsis TaxID=55404 RepID=A0A7W7LDX3_STRNE|nr:SDR family oxidoreductase [Streptomyces netropsis]MBB4888428.1 NAD(P)-dependent dehydrogenase (short-subunit alcohol dehydrogenase family) [Streptomyces netropsis]
MSEPSGPPTGPAGPLWADGTTLLVTGGGAGIGAALCRAFTAAGGQVISLGRTPAALPGGDKGSANGVPTVRSHHVDLGDPDALDAVLDDLECSGTPVRYVVNNASLRAPQALADADRHHWRETFEVNLFAPMEICRRIGARLPEGGAIVNVTSGAARHLSPGTAAYAASQAALEAASAVLGRELAARGVRVNTLAPGPTGTPGLRRAVERGHSLDEAGLAGRIPLGRLGQADEIAAAIMFLLSPAAGFVTGQVLAANGGL